jgi:predicted transcriptional regulator
MNIRTEQIKLADAIIAYLGTKEIVESLGISRQTIYSWRRRGYVPFKAALRMQKIFGDRVRAIEMTSALETEFLNQIRESENE